MTMVPSREPLRPSFLRDSPVSPLEIVSRGMSQKTWHESHKNSYANVESDSPLSPPPSDNLKITIPTAQESPDPREQREFSAAHHDVLTSVPAQELNTSVSECVGFLPQTSKQFRPNFLCDAPLSTVETTSRKVSERKHSRSNPAAPEPAESSFWSEYSVSPLQTTSSKFSSDALFSEKKEAEFAVLEPLLSEFMSDSPLSPMQTMDRKTSIREYLANHQQFQGQNTKGTVRKRLFSEFEQDNFHPPEQGNSQLEDHHQTSSSSSNDARESNSPPRPDDYSPVSSSGWSLPSPFHFLGTGLNNTCNDAENSKNIHRDVGENPLSINTYSPASPAIRLLNIIRNSHADHGNSRKSIQLPKTPFQFSGIVPPRTCIVHRDPEVEKALREHQDAKMPLVTGASKRLQELLSVRNDNEFMPPVPLNNFARDLTELRNPVKCAPALRHLKSSKRELQMDSGVVKNGKNVRAPQGLIADWEMRRTLQNQEGVQSLGLRESLLMHGLQPYGKQCRTNLLSLSFHDVTPDLRTGAFKNKLIAHLEADKIGETKLMAYEVEMPMPERQGLSNGSKPQSGLAVTQRWLAFFISTPLITLADTTTINASPEVFPANLPNPPPSSWLAFAAPCNKIISYPRCKDSMASKTRGGRKVVKEVQRLDFIFSRDGVPTFEFMDKASVLGPVGIQLQKDVGAPFLCAHGLEKYNARGDDKDTPGSPLPEGKRRTRSDAAAVQARVDEDAKKWEARDVKDLRKSKWWSDVEALAYRDAHTWIRIKEAMAKGCCRVVARFDRPGSGRGSGIWA